MPPQPTLAPSGCQRHPNSPPLAGNSKHMTCGVASSNIKIIEAVIDLLHIHSTHSLKVRNDG
jgi:hypothetical protein